MTGENFSADMIRVMGGLETSVQTLNKQMDSFGEDLKQLTSTCQSFEIYTRSRVSLPERVTKLEEVMTDYIKSKPEQDKLAEKVDFLVKRYDAAMVGAVVINAIVLALVWLVQRDIIKVGF